MLEDGARRVRSRHVGPGEVGADTGRLTEVRLDKFNAPHHSIGEVSARKVGLVDFSRVKASLGEVRSSEVSFDKIRLVRSAPMR